MEDIYIPYSVHIFCNELNGSKSIFFQHKYVMPKDTNDIIVGLLGQNRTDRYNSRRFECSIQLVIVKLDSDNILRVDQ